MLGQNEQAKDVLVAFADWADRLTEDFTDEQMQRMLDEEHGGMNESFADVDALTGDERYLRLADRFSHRRLLDPLIDGRDELTGIHANTQIPNVVGFARIAQLAGKADWHAAAKTLWQNVVNDRSVVIGGNSVGEHFHATDDTLSVAINGEWEKLAPEADGYVTLRRAWNDGDVVEVGLPMQVTAERPGDGSNYVAFLYGPIALAAKTDQKDLVGLFAGEGRFDHTAEGELRPLNTAPTFVVDDPADAGVPAAGVPAALADRLRRVEGQALAFTFADGVVTAPEHASLTLIPFAQLHESRYVIYWPIASTGEYEQRQEALRLAEERRMQLDAATADRVLPGAQQSEVDHGFEGEQTERGTHDGRSYRHANGWFSYELAVPDEAAVLQVTYSGQDRRRFAILIDGEPFQQVRLDAERPGQFVEVRYDLPAEAQGKTIRLRFEAEPGSMAGGIFDLRVLRGAELP